MSNKILIIDAMNTFIRNYVVDPSLSATGVPIGGTRGFLKTLQKLVRDIAPTRVIVVWDGGGGSRKRQALAKQYKEGRKPLKLNRSYDGMSALEESQNRYDQLKKTIEYLNEMPVVQLMVDDVEADDVIAYVCQMSALKEDIKIIVSMDKDFLQLCDDSTLLYRPIKNEFLNKKRIVEQYNIHPSNFALARAIDGDKSDNLEGVRGAGLKTIAKRLSFLSEEKSYTLTDVFDYCKNIESDLKLYRNILTEQKKIELNYTLMQLYVPQLSATSSRLVRESVTDFEPSFNRTKVLKMMIEDGINEFNWDTLFQKFRLFVARHQDYLQESS